jgi:hypothetical protein
MEAPVGIISATPMPIGFGSSTPEPMILHVAASGIEGDPDTSLNFDLFNIAMTAALVGQTFTLAPAPLLERFGRFMTNGRQGNLVFEMRNSSGASGGRHSRKTNFSPGSVNGIDLKGFVIEGCELRIDDYKELGQGADGFYMTDGQVTLTIHGWTATEASRAALTQIILFGITQDAGGIVIRPGSGPVPVGPWGWRSLTADDQQILTDMAIRQVTRLLTRLPEE